MGTLIWDFHPPWFINPTASGAWLQQQDEDLNLLPTGDSPRCHERVLLELPCCKLHGASHSLRRMS